MTIDMIKQAGIVLADYGPDIRIGKNDILFLLDNDCLIIWPDAAEDAYDLTIRVLPVQTTKFMPEIDGRRVTYWSFCEDRWIDADIGDIPAQEWAGMGATERELLNLVLSENPA